MGLDSALRKVASNILGKFGTDVTMRQRVLGAYNTATGTQAVTDTDTTVKGRIDDFEDSELSDTIKAGDKKLTVAAADVPFAPGVEDQVIFDGLTYDVVSFKAFIAKDLTAFFVVQLRR